MSTKSQEELLSVMSAAIDDIMEQHHAAAEVWNPHDWVAWADGKNYAFLGGADWTPEEAKESETVRAAVLALLLTKDNMPSYHRLLSRFTPPFSDWGPLVGSWTAEDNRHGIALRDYIVVSRTQDPEDLEMRRLPQVTQGYLQTPSFLTDYQILDIFALMAVHELQCVRFIDQLLTDSDDTVLAGIVEKIRHDDEVQATTFARFLAKAAEADRDQVVAAIDRAIDQQQPIGFDIADFDDQRALLGAYSDNDAVAAKLRALVGI